MGDYQGKIDKLVAKGKETPLLKLAQSKDKATCVAALKGLGKVGRDDAFNLMIPLLHHPDADFRAAAAEALGEMGNEHAKAHIAYQMEKETDARAKKAMSQAMRIIVEK